MPVNWYCCRNCKLAFSRVIDTVAFGRSVRCPRCRNTSYVLSIKFYTGR